MSVEYRNAHEYGEIPVSMPTTTAAPKSARLLSARQQETFMNPREMFENALKSVNTTSSVSDVKIKCDTKTEISNPKDLFENALSSTGKPPETEAKNCVPKTEKKTFDSPYVGNNVQSAKGLFDQALQAAGAKTVGHVNGGPGHEQSR